MVMYRRKGAVRRTPVLGCGLCSAPELLLLLLPLPLCSAGLLEQVGRPPLRQAAASYPVPPPAAQPSYRRLLHPITTAGQPAQEGSAGLLRLCVCGGPAGGAEEAGGPGAGQCCGSQGQPAAAHHTLGALLTVTAYHCFLAAGQGGGGAQGQPGQVEAGPAAQADGCAGPAARLGRQGGPQPPLCARPRASAPVRRGSATAQTSAADPPDGASRMSAPAGAMRTPPCGDEHALHRNRHQHVLAPLLPPCLPRPPRLTACWSSCSLPRR